MDDNLVKSDNAQRDIDVKGDVDVEGDLDVLLENQDKDSDAKNHRSIQASY